MSQYIVCRVYNQNFTLSILSTNRIIPLKDVTHVPDTSDYIMGIMEMEGKIIPVIDLSERFFGEPIKDEAAAQVIIVYWKGKEVGIAVNEVQTIQTFQPSQIDDDLEKITSLNQESDYTPIKSIIRTEAGLILEVDTDNLFEMTGTIEIQELIIKYEEYLADEEIKKENQNKAEETIGLTEKE